MYVREKLEELEEHKESLGHRVIEHGGAVEGSVEQGEACVGEDEVECTPGLQGSQHGNQVGMDCLVLVLVIGLRLASGLVYTLYLNVVQLFNDLTHKSLQERRRKQWTISNSLSAAIVNTIAL